MKTLWQFLAQIRGWLAHQCRLVIVVICTSLLISTAAQAGIAIGLTRVIVSGSDKSGSVQILNEGSHPALLQLWIDNSIAEMDKPIEQIKVPFVVETPVFRLNPNTNKSVRIYYTGQVSQLPSDRESMFWLNVLEVPPKTANDQLAQNEVQIAFRSRIKLFYRPVAIPASAEGVISQLSFKWVPQGSGGLLRVTNPTPFNVTFQTLELAPSNNISSNNLPSENASRVAIKLANDDMVGPKSSIDSPLLANQIDVNDMTVYFSIIDDFGAPLVGQQKLR